MQAENVPNISGHFTLNCQRSAIVFFIFTSAGISLFTIDVTEYIILQENIKKNIVFATSVATTGYAIGGFIWPIVYKLLLDTYAWRGAFLIQAGIVFNQAVLVLILTSGIENTHDDKHRTNLENNISSDPPFEKVKVFETFSVVKESYKFLVLIREFV